MFSWFYHDRRITYTRIPGQLMYINAECFVVYHSIHTLYTIYYTIHHYLQYMYGRIPDSLARPHMYCCIL